MDIGFEALVGRIAAIKGKKVMITMHSMADTDAIASALALASLLPNAEVEVPDILTSNAARIIRKLGFGNAPIGNKFIDDADTIIMVDVNNFGDCGRFSGLLSKYSKEVIVIDHHRLFYNSNATIFSNEGYNSTSSIVFDIAKALNMQVDKNMARLIAMGVISDSAEFKNANAHTFSQLGELFGIGKTDYIELIEETEHFAPAIDRERTATDLFNSTTMVEEDLLFVYGMAHAYANLAADDAIRIGADIALFWSIGHEISFSARIRPNIDKKYGIHAGVIMARLSRIINGTGGGHPAAAGAYGNGIDKGMEFRDAFTEEILKQVRMGK